MRSGAVPVTAREIWLVRSGAVPVTAREIWRGFVAHVVPGVGEQRAASGGGDGDGWGGGDGRG